MRLNGGALLPGASRSPHAGLRSQLLPSRPAWGPGPGLGLSVPLVLICLFLAQAGCAFPAAGAVGVGVTHLHQPLTNPLVLLLLCARPVLFPSGSESFRAFSPLLPR